MEIIICGDKEYPIYEAYCTGKSFWFRIFFGWRESWIDEKGRNQYKYKVWGKDVERLRFLVSEEWGAWSEKDCS